MSEELPAGGMWLRDWKMLKWSAVNAMITASNNYDKCINQGQGFLVDVRDEITNAIKIGKDLLAMYQRGDVYELT